MANDLTSELPSERARQILRILVEHYIREGQPVGSRTLSRSAGLDLSPATIRNVMADLEDLGFIVAPHTSAGRIPTAKGYRFFVDTLVRLQPMAEPDVARLQHHLEDRFRGDAKAIASAASSALSSLTSLAGVVTIPRQPHATLRHIEFLPLSGRRVLAILVVNDAEVQNRILDMDRDYGEDELRRAANFLNEQFTGLDLGEVRSRLLANLDGTREFMNRLMLDSIAIADPARQPGPDSAGYVLSGETQLMNFQELSDVEKIKQLFEAFGQQREILTLLDRSVAAQGVQIFIGEGSGYRILDECTIVAAPYTVDDQIVGVLGVIGPTRMAYERVIPIVDVTARLVGSALNANLNANLNSGS
ncbi:MAG: heat-inducible transcriptional repressor HrcA [Chromatiales bacterium]|nr:heat-inducible transcriptional repressor HrcA [Chromatiales bacterium]